MISRRDILGRFADARGHGDQFMAKCPVHDDRRQSLAIGFADGRCLLRCHAGCDTRDIMGAVGLEWGDLLPEGNARRDLVTKHPPSPGATDGLQLHYYNAADGSPRLRKVREPGKRFRWEAYYPAQQEWRSGTAGLTAGLYRIDEILAARTDEIWVVEGEKDADRLWSLGLPATTTPNGAASAWKDAWSDALEGVSVFVCGDNDPPGQAYIKNVLEALSKRQSGTVCGIDLPDLPDKGDVSDWLDAGGSAAELQALAKRAQGRQGLSFDFGEWLGQWAGKLRQRVVGEAKAIPTPWKAIDGLLGGGWYPGVHLLIGGTGSMKSAFAVQCALKAARGKHPTVYLSLETSNDLFLSRIVGITCGWPWNRVYKGQMAGLEPPDGGAGGGWEPEEVLDAGIAKTLETLGGAPLCVQCRRPYQMTVSELGALMAQVPEGSFVVLDYVGLVAGDDVREDQRRITDKVMGVLMEAAETKAVTVLAVVATQRSSYSTLRGKGPDVERPGEGNPARLLAAGKESGGLEYGSTTTMVLVQEPESDDTNEDAKWKTFHLALAKNRLGAPGWGKLRYFFDKSAFSA